MAPTVTQQYYWTSSTTTVGDHPIYRIVPEGGEIPRESYCSGYVREIEWADAFESALGEFPKTKVRVLQREEHELEEVF